MTTVNETLVSMGVQANLDQRVAALHAEWSDVEAEYALRRSLLEARLKALAAELEVETVALRIVALAGTGLRPAERDS